MMKRGLLFRSVLTSSIKTSTVSRYGLYILNRARFSSQATSTPVEDTPAVVSKEWLADNIGKVKVLDASWFLSGAAHTVALPGALRFDIDQVADESSPKPHKFPPAKRFATEMDKLGVTNQDHVVIYDHSRGHLIASARAWWLFRAFGHSKVSVLEGGYQNWPEGVKIPQTAQPAAAPANPAVGNNFRAVFNKSLLWTTPEVLANLTTGTHLLVDARSEARWKGAEPEPRGVPGGSILESYNLPYTKLFQYDALAAVYKINYPDQLHVTLTEAGLPTTGKYPIVTTCGSGITACVNALVFHTLGYKNVAVYDGSWIEWASDPNNPRVRVRSTDNAPDIYLRVLGKTGLSIHELRQQWEKLSPEAKVGKLEAFNQNMGSVEFLIPATPTLAQA